MLMETPWSIEYGKNLVSKLTIHEEMLRCHSKAFEKLCATAKPLQERYVKCRDLMASLGSCGYPEVTQKQFKAERMERMVRQEWCAPGGFRALLQPPGAILKDS